MSFELIKPTAVAQVVHLISRGYPAPAIQRANGRIFWAPEVGEPNAELRFATRFLPVFHQLRSLQTKRRK